MFNKSPFQSSKRQKGFTLVEVIVVAVIVAILAGVSIPLYLGYINNSKMNAATNAAGSVASFANACTNAGGVIAAGTHEGSAATKEVVCDMSGTVGMQDSKIVVPSGVRVVIDATTVKAQAEDADDVAVWSTIFTYKAEEEEAPAPPEE